MSTDISQSFILKLAIQGYTFSNETKCSIKASYYVCFDALDKYKADEYNALEIDLNSEESC